MPLKYNSTIGMLECPVGKFRAAILSSGRKGYVEKDSETKIDALGECITCQLGNTLRGLSLENICQCPSNIDEEVYEREKKEYILRLPPDKKFIKREFELSILNYYKNNNSQ